MTKIKNPAIQTGLPDPAMAGDEISDEEINAMANACEHTAHNYYSGQSWQVLDRIKFARALLALKRVQPASGEDAKRLGHLLMNCVGTDENGFLQIRFETAMHESNHKAEEAAPWIRQDIDAAMQQEASHERANRHYAVI